MAELATIARPYAEALYQAAGTDLATTGVWLDELAAIAGQPSLLQFADNPKVRGDQVFDLVAGVARAPLPDTAGNFLRTVIDNGRLAALPAIAQQFRELANARSGSADAVVYSAFPMDAAALQQLSGALEKRFGQRLQLTVQHDPALIGGVRVVVGDEVLDTSVRAQLEHMRAVLSA